ncbi:MAG: DUF2911 domain-containing protein [Holophagales bacterium]|jgi:hypothetical protein|nr:DUF2911 domain-containing protein [Holophagales bacterium]
MRDFYKPIALLFMLTACCAVTRLAAQGASLLLPSRSPRASVSQVVGICTVTIEYHRPGVRSRAIWGELVPFGEVWRTGANQATTISFTHPVKVAGNPVPAGKYALFTIPGSEKWTVILNKKHQQFGSFEYDPAEDMLRFDAPPVAASFSERLTFEICPADDSSASVDLKWESLSVSFMVEIDLDEAMEAQLKDVLAKAEPTDWTTRYQAARYLLNSKKDMPQAMKLIEESIKILQTPQNFFVKAQIQRLGGSATEGVKTLEQAIDLAQKQKPPSPMLKALEDTLSQWKLEDQKK